MDLTQPKEILEIYNKLFYQYAKLVIVAVVFFLCIRFLLKKVTQIIWSMKGSHGQSLTFYSATYDEKEVLDYIKA